MRFVVQRVKRARVFVEGELSGEIADGFVVLIGVGLGDTKAVADKMVKKLLGLRIFADEEGKTNRSLSQVEGGLILVSQFTLYADMRRGNRPGFALAADPKLAEELYEYVVELCRKEVSKVGTGSFGADMQVELVNDGPFTVIMDSKELGMEG
ncbi:MAG: D-tyrosyl-tRNA(Tyr) deacylase [Blautia sp.]|nr:D-tyrosyl-tRNA(Tyr) deacylase [Blautia sp.]